MNGFALLSGIGSYVTKHPTETAAVGVAGATGLSLTSSVLSHPMDTAMEVTAAAGEPHAWALGGIGLGVVGLGLASSYGMESVVKNHKMKEFTGALGKTGKALGSAARVTSRVGGMMGSAVNPGRAVGGAVKAYGAMWDSTAVQSMGGWKFMAGGTMLAGAGFGLMKAGFNMSLNAPDYESAMARAEEGSAYEGGTGAFGNNTGVRAMGQSTMGLVGGLRNKHL